jgi:hypothetical protein
MLVFFLTFLSFSFSCRSPAVAANPAAAPASNNAFSSVKLASSSSGGGGGGGAFTGFTFGAPSPAATATAPSAAPSLSSSYPSFAMPVIKAIVPTTASKNDANTSTTTTTAADKERIKCAESFRKHILNVNQLDLVAMGRFISTYGAISDDGNNNKDNNNKITTSSSATTTTTTTETKTWDPNRPLFPTNPSKLVSTTKMSPTAPSPLFGGVGKAVIPSFSPTAPSPTAGGFSFSLPKTTAASPAVPAFSFSTVPTPEVKAAAAATTAASTTKGEDDNDDNEETTVLEAADDDYNNIVQCNTKVLQVKANQYIARGKLKLEQHKESKKYRLVVRDKTVGRVQFNTAINHGMPLIKETVAPNPKKAGSKPIHVVVITAVLTVGDKPELFKIITTKEDQESLYNALNKIVA